MPVVIPASTVEPISDGRYPHGDIITVINRTKSGKDREGNDTFVEDDNPITYIGAFDPAIGFESTTLQDQVQTQPGVYLPYVAVVNSYSVIVVQTGPHAGQYEVDGVPAYWKNPHTGHTPGVQVPLKQVSG